jgi:hypothetical protein
VYSIRFFVAKQRSLADFQLLFHHFKTILVAISDTVIYPSVELSIDFQDETPFAGSCVLASSPHV